MVYPTILLGICIVAAVVAEMGLLKAPLFLSTPPPHFVYKAKNTKMALWAYKYNYSTQNNFKIFLKDPCQSLLTAHHNSITTILHLVSIISYFIMEPN